jgi:hypothetical protein
MPVEIGFRRRLTTTLTWPFGIAWTAAHYTWRILPVYRGATARRVHVHTRRVPPEAFG